MLPVAESRARIGFKWLDILMIVWNGVGDKSLFCENVNASVEMLQLT